jgi:uncharacterized protein (DUF58 family)
VSIDQRLEPDRVVVGGQARGVLTITNEGRTPSPPFTAVVRAGAGTIPVPVPAIAPRGTARRPYAVPATRRGRVVLGPVVVTRHDPLGLVRRRQPHPAERTLWVHPRHHPAVPVPTGVDVELEGSPVPNAPRGAVTFASLREYVPGDDVRQIHWRSTARTGVLMVRDHVDTSQPRTTVALDGRADRWTASSFEDAVEVAASLALASERAGRPAVLVAPLADAGPGAAAPPASLLDRLALVAPWDDGGARVLDRLESVPPGGAAVIVTGHPDGPTLTRAAGLRRRFALVAVVGVVPGAVARSERRTGLLVLTAGSGRGAVALWNTAVRG